MKAEKRPKRKEAEKELKKAGKTFHQTRFKRRSIAKDSRK